MQINEMNGRSLAGVASELKDEFKEFANTRLAMLQAEMKEKLGTVKMALPGIVIGALVLATCWLLLTGAIVAAIAVAFGGNPFAPAIALAIVGVLYGIIGGLALAFALRGLRQQSVVPERTLRVLKDDQVWLSNEARVQL